MVVAACLIPNPEYDEPAGDGVATSSPTGTTGGADVGLDDADATTSTATSPPADETSGSSGVAETGLSGPTDPSGPLDETTAGFDYDTPCDAYNPSSCPPGYGCKPNLEAGNWATPTCHALAQLPMGEGMPCVTDPQTHGADDCDDGLACWFVDTMNGNGVCVSLCQGNPDAPLCVLDEQRCSQENDFGVCRWCHPLDPSASCPVGQVCIAAAGEQQTACLPGAVDQAGVGAACMFENDCAPGLACVSGSVLPSCNEASCCAYFCDLSLDMDCPDGNTCTELGLSGPGIAELGVCTG